MKTTGPDASFPDPVPPANRPVIDEALRAALHATLEIQQPRFVEVPSPVNFRASGALAAWSRVFDVTPAEREVRAVLADARRPISAAMYDTADVLHRRIRATASERKKLFQPLFANACHFLSFWWRGGMLYEPTEALGTLLGETDWSQDVPMRYVCAPVPALCIVPPKSQRAACADMCSLMVFTHEPLPARAASATRALTVVAVRPAEDGTFYNTFFSLTVADENEPLADVLDRLDEGMRTEAPLFGSDEDELRHQSRFNRQVMDYVVKVLLYLNYEGAQIKELKPYSNAPRVFPGLGRRKRETKLAEIEQLYDRFVVGPERLPLASDKAAGSEHSGFEVSTHWRCGHFRMQPHGPQASLRKLMFIAPTIVRADKLPDSH